MTTAPGVQPLCTWRGWTGVYPGYSGASGNEPCRWDAPASYAGLGPVRYAEFTYSPNGQRATVKDAGNNLSQFVYNEFDLLKELHFPNGTAGSGTASATDYESHLYDANGNRTSLTKRDRTTTIAYTFDTLNRMIFKNIPGGTAADVAFEYDPAGRPLWAKFVDDNGSGIVYGYGQAKRLTSEASFGRSVGFDYDAAGNRTKVIWPDGNWVYSNFDNLNRVTKVCENGVAGCPSGLLITYTLDPLSRRDAITRSNATAGDFDYDLASRLTLLTQDVSGTTNDLSRTFTYSPAGQLRTRTNATAAHWLAATPGSSAYAANGRNQYTTVAGASYGYDLNGNLTSTGTRTYGYDAENRLTSVSGGASLTLTYDPLGRLRQTTAGATTTDFLYEGDRLLAEYNGSTLLRRYAHGPGVDEPIVWYEGAALTTKRWLHPDERGSIVAWSDAGGAATVYRYGPYGEPAGGDFSGARFRYTGQIALPEVGLYHYKARVYDPALGRFLQTDPVGYQDDFNLYAYVRNDAINAVDPDGSYTCKGTPGQCGAIARALQRANEAASKMEEGSEDQKKLNAVLSFIGKYGDNNGVLIKFTPKVRFADASVDDDGHTVTIRVNNRFHSLDGYEGNADSNRAGTLVHEGQHGVDERKMGRDPILKNEELQTERRAYDIQSKVHRALGHTTGLLLNPRLWDPSSRFTEDSRKTAVEQNARISTATWCSTRGPAEGCP